MRLRIWHWFFVVLAATLFVSGTAWAQGDGSSTPKKKKAAAAAPAPIAADPDPAPAPAAQPAHEQPGQTAEEKEDEAEDAAHHHAPRTWKISLFLDKLSKFEVGPGTFNAEFFVFYMCDAEPCKPEPDLVNGKITGKDKIGDEGLLKVFRFKAELEATVDLSEFPFDVQTLPITFTDKDENVKLVDEPELFKKMDIPSVSPDVRLPGWQIDKKLTPVVTKHKLGSLESDELSYQT
ncbi:MAG TPA: hypothetical protein VIF62_16195, partial [Labilithrix sp.]